MTARTDRSDLGRYSPAYATGRELGKSAVRQISRRFGRTTGARVRSAADYSITATLSVVPDPLGSRRLAGSNMDLEAKVLAADDVAKRLGGVDNDHFENCFFRP